MFNKIFSLLIISLAGSVLCFSQTANIQSSVVNTYITVKMCLGDEVILDGDDGEDAYYDWDTEEYEKTITVYEPGKYVVTITKEEDENYLATKTFYVKAADGPAINRVSIMPKHNAIKIHTREEGEYEYSLNGKDFQASNVFKNLKNGPYEFYARDIDSCEAVGPVFRFIKL